MKIEGSSDQISDQCVEAYQGFLDNMRHNFPAGNPPLTVKEWLSDRMFLAVDLTPDLSAGSSYWSRLGRGNVALEMKFDRSLTENVILISVAEMEKVMSVDSVGKVSVLDAPIH